MSQNRPPNWAESIQNTNLRNLYRIDDSLYRCEQPNTLEFKQLSQLGIKQVLNLRFWHSNRSKIGKLPLDNLHIPMQAHNITDEDIITGLRLILNRKGGLVFHCLHGSDRTGTLCAAYRIVVQNWDREEAIKELINGGYGYHTIYSNIPRYLRSMNVEQIQNKLKSSK